MHSNLRPVVIVTASAALFGVSAPLAKSLVQGMPPTELAGLLYLGAFLGLGFFAVSKSLLRQKGSYEPVTRMDTKWLAGSIVSGGIVAPILMVTGLTLISGFTASLLLNLEGVFTALLAVTIFRQKEGKRLWAALLMMTLASILLTYDPVNGGFRLEGTLFLAGAMLCWGLDNNLTQRISGKDPVQISMAKGAVAGSASIGITLLLGSQIVIGPEMVYALILGAFSYGASLVLFILALSKMGSARTAALFAVGPFIGALVSIPLLGESIQWLMLPSAVLMATAVWMITGEKHVHEHRHQAVIHSHPHDNDDPHHRHHPGETIEETHSHMHTHEETVHSHSHWPDTSHQHEH
ncbi:MAG TPA: EamA family transporter [Methanomassiliicoccales archaeon]